ncbi:MAG: phosphate acyltransferase PlsX [Candidatus Omnitrophica bacterium]|nr:phosphate acyltransferase PlsX [Candidatus Omnitrophota bacterium]
MNYKIGLDVSGGDFAPEAIIKGALLAKKELEQDIVLIGVKSEIEQQLKLNNCSVDKFEIVDASEKIEMADSPTVAVRRKKKSSIVIGADLLRDKKIDAFVSLGNTGAVVAAATLRLRMIEGVERPGIALLVPSKTGISLMIDVGANIDCKPLHLLQYGIMASVYYSSVLNKDNPTVGLLNIGEEASKGLSMLKDSHKLFEASSLNFTGNVEPKEIFSGKCDCIVCDGFIGNVALKVAEGSVKTVGRFLIESMSEGFLGKLGLLLASSNLRKFKRKMDYSDWGGAPLLGVNGIVIIGHGRSNGLAVKNAIKVAVRELKRNLTEEIKEKVDEICKDSRVRQILTS